MKKLLIIPTILILFFLGCESLPSPESNTAKETVNEQTPQQNTAIAQQEIPQQQNLETIEETVVPQENLDFISHMGTTNIKIISQPSTTTKNRAFNAPYVISVTENGQPVSDMSVTILYPSSRNNDEIIYAVEELKTDDKGNISFTPQKPTFAVDDMVTFYPTPINDDEDVVEAAKNVSATSSWRVRTDYISRQGMIYVFDHDTKGRAGNNSFAMLQALRNLGFNIGNGPISDSSYLTRPVNDLYKATKSMAGDAFGMLVSGSVKYAEPIKSVDGGYECLLVADITCINMANGTILYQTDRTKSAIAKTEFEALTKCREALAAEVAQAVLYGM